MKKIIFKLLVLIRLHVFFREIIQKNKVSILLFHELDLHNAKKCFLYLKENYSLISLSDYILYRQNKKSLPPKSLIITFDDGCVSNYNLLPLFVEMNIVPTIFLCSEIVGTKRRFWFKHPQAKDFVRKFKGLKNSNRLDLLKNYGFHQDLEFEEISALSLNHIEEMRPYVDFQAHTKYHPILPNCLEEEAFEEICGSKASLYSSLNLNINAFAYPNGDYSDREIEIVKQCGYTCAVTTKPGFNDFRTNLFELKRLDPNDTTDFNEFLVKTSGIQSLFSY